ncbi:hypothetical protein FCV25MIE_02192 [Fagus crenata]
MKGWRLLYLEAFGGVKRLSWSHGDENVPLCYYSTFHHIILNIYLDWLKEQKRLTWCVNGYNDKKAYVIDQPPSGKPNLSFEKSDEIEKVDSLVCSSAQLLGWEETRLAV